MGTIIPREVITMQFEVWFSSLSDTKYSALVATFRFYTDALYFMNMCTNYPKQYFIIDTQTKETYTYKDWIKGNNG